MFPIPFQPADLAQNDLCLGPDLVGAFRSLPVARLYLARPLAVKPPPALTDSFSPRPTDRLGLLAIHYRLLLARLELLTMRLVLRGNPPIGVTRMIGLLTLRFSGICFPDWFTSNS